MLHTLLKMTQTVKTHNIQSKPSPSIILIHPSIFTTVVLHIVLHIHHIIN